METIRQDLAYAYRVFRRHYIFTAFAVLTLAVGIAANASLFTIVDALLLRSLTFHDPERLVWIENSSAGSEGIPLLTGQANYRDWRVLNHAFQDLGAYVPSLSERGGFILSGNGDPIDLKTACVSGNLMDLLGIQPHPGRPFTEEESQRDGPHAVILSEGFWRRQYAADTNILGRTIEINGIPHFVVGILPAKFQAAFADVFRAGGRPDIFVPFRSAPGYDNWGNMLAVVGKLKPGIQIDQAQSELNVLDSQLQSAHPERGEFAARLVPLRDHVTNSYRRSLWLLTAAVSAVLLIVCVNLSSLLLARSTSRKHEMSVRVALGAGRSRLIRQMLTESILLSTIGGAIGLLLTFGIISAVSKRHPASFSLLDSVRVDSLALCAIVFVAVSAGLLFGLVPALTLSRRDLNEAGRATTQGLKTVRITGGFVIAEVALAFVLTSSAGLLIHSFFRLLEVDPGFRADHAFTCRIETYRQFPSQPASIIFYQDLLRRVQQIPGIDAATLPDKLPLALNDLVRARPKDAFVVALRFRVCSPSW
jgi:predicted permease